MATFSSQKAREFLEQQKKNLNIVRILLPVLLLTPSLLFLLYSLALGKAPQLGLILILGDLIGIVILWKIFRPRLRDFTRTWGQELILESGVLRIAVYLVSKGGANSDDLYLEIPIENIQSWEIISASTRQMAIHRVLLSNRSVVEIYRDPIEDVENQFLSELKPHGTPIVPLSNAQLPARTNKTGTQEQALYLVALVLSLIGLTILRLVFPPLKFWTDLLALAAYAAIPGLLIFIFLQRQRNGATHDERGNRAQGFVRFIACATFAAFSLFTLNIVLEKKPPEEFSGIVLEKFTESQKHSLSHFLVVPVPDQVPGFKENTNIRVSPEDYRAVVPGSTTIKVFWHKGFFRIPWLKSYLLNRISH